MPSLLISVRVLADWLDGPEAPVLLDCRSDLADPTAGRRAWAAGHIGQAHFADLAQDLSDPTGPAAAGRHPLPQPAAFANTLRSWGIDRHRQVVVYDHGPGALAARAWWLLRQCGINVQLLDGGLQAWQAAGGELRTGAPCSPPEVEALNVEFEGWLDNADLADNLGQGRCVLIDAREAARYRGEIEPIDPIAGHIPGACNRPFAENLDAQGRFLPAGELRAAFEALLGEAATEPHRVVHQCGSGVTACHNLLAMEIAGLRGSRLHAPSWSGWIAEGRPVARD